MKSPAQNASTRALHTWSTATDCQCNVREYLRNRHVQIRFLREVLSMTTVSGAIRLCDARKIEGWSTRRATKTRRAPPPCSLLFRDLSSHPPRRMQDIVVETAYRWRLRTTASRRCSLPTHKLQATNQPKVQFPPGE